MANIVVKLTEQLQPIIENAGYELYDLEYEKEGKNYFLRIFIDTLDDSLINLDDCITVNGLITDELDETDPLENEYMLEVTSPGIIRKLKTKKHFEKQLNNEIELKTYRLIDGFESKKIIGNLTNVNDEEISIDEKPISFKDIAKAQSTFDFKGDKK